MAKELDKHALCKAIMESAENKADVKNLIAQVDFVLPDGKVIYSTEKVLLHGENNRYKIDREGEEKKLAALDAEGEGSIETQESSPPSKGLFLLA